MFAFLKKLFSPKKKSKPQGGFAYIKESETSAVSSQSTLEAALPLKENLPAWYKKDPTLQEITLNAAPLNYTPPRIRPEIRTLLTNYVREVSPEPSKALAIYRTMNNSETSLSEISNLIATEPVLTAEILRLVNSAFYGLPNEVTSVGKAVPLLGIRNIKSLIMNLSLKSAIGAVSKEEKAIKDHSGTVSAIARIMAEKVPNLDPYEAGTLGLLHDMGKLLYPKVKEAGKDVVMNIDIPLPVVESLLASVFASLWELPKSICEAVEYTHYPCYYPENNVPEEYRPMTNVIAASNLLAKCYGFGDGEELVMLHHKQCEAMNLAAHPGQWLSHEQVEKIESCRSALL